MPGSSTIHSATLPASRQRPHGWAEGRPTGGSIPTFAVTPDVRLLNIAVPCVGPNGAQTVHEIRSPTPTGKSPTVTGGSQNHSVHGTNVLDVTLPPDTTHRDSV